jgi:CRP-like cAMP-binding protein
MASSRKNDGIINRLLLALPLKTLNRIRGVLEPVGLPRGQAIAHIDQPLRYVYFVNRGLISVVKTMHDGRLVEVGAIGIEGMTSAITLIGFDKIVLEAIVQIPGSAFRMSRDAAIETERGRRQSY